MKEILDKSVKAPYIPKMEGKTDLRNFDPEVLGEGLTESIVNAESKALIKNKDEAFTNFGPLV